MTAFRCGVMESEGEAERQEQREAGTLRDKAKADMLTRLAEGGGVTAVVWCRARAGTIEGSASRRV